MTHHTRRFAHTVTLGLACLSTWACSQSSPSTPTPTPTDLTVRIQGLTRDSAMRPIAGVTVQATAGATVGPAVMSQENGTFAIEMTGVTSNVVLRATKEGYAPATTTIQNVSYRNVMTVFFTLRAPGVITPGEYRVTMAGDCPDFPADLRTRSYSATMTASNDGLVLVRLMSPFLSWGDFGLSVIGSFVYLDIDSGVNETLPDHTYWRFTAYAETVVDEPVDGRTVVPFSGAVEYCVLRSAAPAATFCSATPEETLVHRQCRSDEHTLIFERR